MARSPRPPIRSLSSYQEALKTKKLSPLHKWAVFTLLMTLIFNIGIIVCGALWTKSLRSNKKANPPKAPIYDNLKHIIFYTFVLPGLSILSLAILSILQLIRRLPAKTLLIYSIFFLLGWAAQMGIWYRCEIYAKAYSSGKRLPKMCPQRGGFLTVGAVKAPLAMLIVVVEVILMSISAAQVDRDRMAFSVSGIPHGFWI